VGYVSTEGWAFNPTNLSRQNNFDLDEIKLAAGTSGTADARRCAVQRDQVYCPQAFGD
jgi:hypothetical protein